MEIVQYDKPVDRVRAFIRDYAQQLYGIDNACALAPLVEVAFAPSGANMNVTNQERISAARELLKYSEVPTRSVEYQGGNSGPDLSVEILGACHIVQNEDSQSVEPTHTPDSYLELSHDGREEGS